MQRKTIFDAVRKLLGRGFRPREVEALDTAINAALHGKYPSANHAVGPEGIALIKSFEGCARLRPDGLVEAYPDPGTGAEPWTIGWGATGAGIGPDTVWTRSQCDARLEADLGRYAADVARAIGDAPTGQVQFDALVSFHYNTGAIARATLTNLHRSGDFEGAAREFMRWKFAGGRLMNGLLRRRKAEEALYRSMDTAQGSPGCTPA